MSSPLFKTDVLFIQRMLACAGLYKGKLDGKFGKLTQAAEDEFDKLYTDYGKKYGMFDLRTEGVIQTLIPNAQIQARKFMQLASHFSLTVKLISGTRTYDEQNVLYAKRPKVTNAKGGQSNHNFGIAWDIGIWSDGVYYTGATKKQDNAYTELSKIILPTMSKLLTWGGNWRTIIDKPHYEITTNKSITQVRKLFEAGKLNI